MTHVKVICFNCHCLKAEGLFSQRTIKSGNISETVQKHDIYRPLEVICRLLNSVISDNLK